MYYVQPTPLERRRSYSKRHHYHPPKDDVEDHTLLGFATPMPVRPRQRSQRRIRSDSQSEDADPEDFDDDSEMWKMFLDKVKEEDSRFTDAWKEDANSIVVFTGLFSAIVGAFIIEFYKQLSGDQTVALLQQISHQLPNSPNTTNSSSNTANQPSSPGTAIVWVNALWLISLVLSLTCALIATLLQQWARRYIETPGFSNVPRHRARVRSLLLVGTKSYKIPIIVEMLPTLLHLSVYLFLAGLVIAFHTINKKVAIAVNVAVGVSGLAYLVLSILPCLDAKCPYRTPISQILWYPCRAFLSFAAPFLQMCRLGLCALINRPAQSSGLSVSDHWRYFTYGLEKSIVYHAIETLEDGDRGRVTWLFTQLALGDRQTFLKFAASIPIHRIPDLIPSIKSVPFRESLLILLRSVADTRPGIAAWVDPSVHKRSLLVCLHAICHIAKAEPTIADLDFMRDHFADTSLMRGLWNDDDNSIRITSRSICALVARQVIRKRRLQGEELNWLQDVTGSSSNGKPETKISVWDQMNFKSFVYGVLPNSASHLSTKDATSFSETLAILLGVEPHGPDYFTGLEWQTRLSEEVGRMQRYGRQAGLEVFDRLRLVFPSLPPITSAHAVVDSSSLIPPPSPVLPLLREAPPRGVHWYPPRAPPSPRPVLHRPAPYRAPPSPRPASPRAHFPPPPREVYPLYSIRPSDGAHRHRAPT